MTIYYQKEKINKRRNSLRFFALLLVLSGVVIASYVFFPLVSWKIYFTPVFASQDITAPIPKTTIISQNTLQSLVSQATSIINGTDYGNAQNWFPYHTSSKTKPAIVSYLISIPKLGIKEANVSTIDYDLSKHLVHYAGTALPPETGNTVIFGHSTLPQLFNPNDYKTIFANAYKLKTNDDIFVTIGNVLYHYKIFSITVVDPTDTSLFSQNIDSTNLTLVTCTPPGTTWKRLIIKSRLVPI